jgi:hypothetical protein
VDHAAAVPVPVVPVADKEDADRKAKDVRPGTHNSISNIFAPAYLFGALIQKAFFSPL